MKKSTVAVATLVALTLSAPVWAAGNSASTAVPAKKEMKKTVKEMKTVRASARIKALQEALNKHGAKLKVDGFMGRETEHALRTFQKEQKLKVTGHLDKATEAKLGLTK